MWNEPFNIRIQSTRLNPARNQIKSNVKYTIAIAADDASIHVFTHSLPYTVLFRFDRFFLALFQ